MTMSMMNGSNRIAQGASRSLAAIAVVAVGLFLLALTPVRAGTVLNQVGKLLASDGAAGDYFGSVAISGDTAVVGAFADDDNGTNSGSAYVFVRNSNGVWTQQAKLLASDGTANDHFGLIVAIDDDTVIIGANGHDDNGIDSGAAYIFVRDASDVWSQQAVLLASDGKMSDRFGGSVAISDDTVLIGAQHNLGNGMGSGSAYVFVRDATGAWSQQAKLHGTSGDWFGDSVAISGNTAVIGAFLGDGDATDSGSVYIFVRDATGAWSLQAKLLANDGASSDGFGVSVAISGATAVVGSFGADGNVTDSGSAYVFDLMNPTPP